MWGIIPAAGNGSRMQPLAFSKELLPVGSREDAAGEHPKAVSEYLLERMTLAGASKICFVISPGKSDILQYYGSRVGRADLAYVVQPKVAGLCDAIFRARPLIHRDEAVVVGLPDTIWFPADALRALPADGLSFLLFPVEHPELFDAVVMDERGRVLRVEVKSHDAHTRWVWGAFRMPGHIYHELHDFWLARGAVDEYVGTLVNAWLGQGGEAAGIGIGQAYVDVGTLHGYREAVRLLGSATRQDPGPHASPTPLL